MSLDQYQRTVNSLDREIAELEKKKATADKKAADEAKKAAGVSIGKNASASIIRSKMNMIERHTNASNKATADSADYAKKIADKRKKRNDAYLKLQKEQQREQKKQQIVIKNIQQRYEERIAELESQAMPTILNSQIQLDESPQEQYDVFISHAWEDKEGFVDELVSEMRKEGIVVWYDTTQMAWGDSMRQRIDDGLKKSKFGVVVLSPNYIAEDKYWTKAELNGLFQLESVNGKILLPIWYNLNKKDVMDFSPVIADKKAITTASMTAQEIAKELSALLQKDSEEDQNYG